MLVNVVRLGDVRNHRGHIEPVVLEEHSAAQEGNGDTLVLLFSGAGAGIVADFREARGHGGVGSKSEAGGQVVGGLYGGGIVELVFHHAVRLNGYSLLVPFSVGVGVRVADVEASIACIGNLVGRHAVVFQSATVEQAEFGGYLPIVGKVQCEFVLVALGVFRTQFVEPVILCVACSLWAGQNFGCLCSRGCPLEGRGVIVEVVEPLVQSEAHSVIAQLPFEFSGEERVLHLAEMKPGTAAFHEPLVGRAVFQQEIVRSRDPTDGAAAKVHVVGLGGVHVLGIDRPFRAVVEAVVVEQGQLMALVAREVAEASGLHPPVEDVHVGEGPSCRSVARSAQLEAGKLFHAAVAHIDKGCCIDHRAESLALGKFVLQRQFTLAEESGQSCVVELRAVAVVGKLRVEAARVEVLVHARRVEPLVSDAARNVQVEVLPAEVVGLVVQHTAEVFLSQLGERTDRIGHVAREDGRLRRCHQADLAQARITAPVGRQLVYR